MGLGIVGVGGTPLLAAATAEILRDCDAGPGGTLILLLRGGFPGLELVRYTIPVPVLGIGFEKPGVVGVVGVLLGFVVVEDVVVVVRIRCWSCRFRLYVSTCPDDRCGSSPGWMPAFIDWESRRGRGVLVGRVVVYEGMGFASEVGEGVVGEGTAGVDWVTDGPPCPFTPPVDETEEAPESVRGRKSPLTPTSLLLLPTGARSANVEGYFRNAEGGNGGNPLSLSKCCCRGIGASSGVTGIGKLMVDAVDDDDGVSTASLPDLDDDNPLWRVLLLLVVVEDSGGLPRTP